jgi:predicted Zn-dependent peptidase
MSNMKINFNKIEQLEKNCKIKTLDCGITVVHMPHSIDNSLYLSAIFATGARNEKKNISGISHFLEHMMFRGSEGHPSFISLANAFEWLGGDWNAETGHEHTEYSFSGITQSTEKAI